MAIKQKVAENKQIIDTHKSTLITSSNRIILIGSSAVNHMQFIQFEDVSSYLLQGGTSSTDVLFLLNKQLQDEEILKIRSNPSTKLCRIYVTNETSISKQLTCGLINNKLDNSNYHLEKIQKVLTDNLDDINYFVLCFMWVFDKSLKPKLNPTNPTLYSFEMLDLLTGDFEESKKVLKFLLSNEFIYKSKLVNRIRQCKNCSSAHLNFVDVCPKCKSLETEAFSSLHCFKCGFVGKQQRFTHKQGLSCPNCLTNLRHIGVDYDRPIESINCLSCEHVFNDHEVVAECLNCSTINPTDSLVPLNLYEYELTSLGVKFIKSGESKKPSLPNLGEQLSSQHIFWLIDWLNKLAKRHNQKHSVLSIKATELDAYIAEYGEISATDRIDEIQSRLLGLLRTTDVCSNYSEHGILMLIPMTSGKNIKHILEKLKQIQETQVDAPLVFDVRYIELPFEERLNSSVEVIDIINSKSPVFI